MTGMTHLDDSLAKLRSEIQALDIGDREARLRLEKLIEDIERTLADPKAAGADASLGEQLKTSVLAFEVSHPRIATVMNEVVEKLGQMGI
ncbi:MAG: DUF4404 family protein [Burkholderiales bacterium]|nr:DUF4404 family protein [Burkholderiales bacterium]